MAWLCPSMTKFLKENIKKKMHYVSLVQKLPRATLGNTKLTKIFQLGNHIQSVIVENNNRFICRELFQLHEHLSI